MSLSQEMMKKAGSFYSCAADLDVEIQKLTEARDLLNRRGDQYSDASSALFAKEGSADPAGERQP